MFAKLTKRSSNPNYNHSHTLISRTAIPSTLLTACPIFFQLKHQYVNTNISDPEAVFPEAPPLTRAMKKPILSGRNSKTMGHEVKDVIPNPFRKKPLPFGRRITFENQLDEDLAKGKYWSKFIDRNSEVHEYDLYMRAFGNADFYRIPAWKPPYDDITAHNDFDFQFRISNLGMHVGMVRYIPHLKPLVPEMRKKYEAITRKWQDIVAQAIDNKEDGFESNTTITTKWREGPETKINAKREKEIRENGTKEEKRKLELKKKVHYATIKKFVDTKVDEHEWVKLIFVDAMGTKHYVYGMVGETLLQCCRRYSIPIDGYCNGYDRGFVRIYGEGSWCGQCQMDLSPRYFHLMPAADWRERNNFPRFKEITPTSRLGCCIWIRPEFDGMIVNIPKTLFLPYGNVDSA